VVETVIHMAHSLGMSAIVEAVETVSQVEIVRSFNADAAQGFFFARPMSRENAADLAGSADVPYFSRTETRTLVRPGETGAPSRPKSESGPADDTVDTVDEADAAGRADTTDEVDTAEGRTAPVETD
jgi:hypothetical protein